MYILLSLVLLSFDRCVRACVRACVCVCVCACACACMSCVLSHKPVSFVLYESFVLRGCLLFHASF